MVNNRSKKEERERERERELKATTEEKLTKRKSAPATENLKHVNKVLIISKR